jgi:hypothetical protein
VQTFLTYRAPLAFDRRTLGRARRRKSWQDDNSTSEPQNLLSRTLFNHLLPLVPSVLRCTAASFATYPANSLASGAVVLDVTIGSTGKAAKVHVIRDVQSLTPQATKAVKTWAFSPATFQGTTITSHMVIAFVFPNPGTGSF